MWDQIKESRPEPSDNTRKFIEEVGQALVGNFPPEEINNVLNEVRRHCQQHFEKRVVCMRDDLHALEQKLKPLFES